MDGRPPTGQGRGAGGPPVRVGGIGVSHRPPLLYNLHTIFTMATSLPLFTRILPMEATRPRKAPRLSGPCINHGVRRGLWQWCPHCYTNVRKRTNHRGHVSFVTPPRPLKVFTESPMKKPDRSQSAAIAATGQADEAFQKKYPNVLAYLLDTAWDDGSPREPSSLALSLKDGQWQAALNDKALKASFYSSAPDMLSSLRLLEKALAEGVSAWRPWKKGK